MTTRGFSSRFSSLVPSGLPTPTGWLSAALVGVYVLVVVGATASLADAAEACSTWPACSGTLNDPAVAVAVGHRILAGVVGLLVLIAGIAVLRSDADRRTRAAAALALVLFPAQVAVGAFMATSPSLAFAPGLHLLVGIAIFAALLLSLAWHLESETGGSDAGISTEELEPAPLEEDESSDTPVTPLADRSLGVRLRERAFAYFRLMKPRLMWLLSLVAAAAMALAAANGFAVDVPSIVYTLTGGVLSIGASGTFNHVLERDRDKRMSRTNDRPLATHQVPKWNALAFGFVLTGLSVFVFLQTNILAAALGLVAILFYSIVYTLVLKPNTVQNTVLGGAAGSLPALIGWTAVTGRIDVAALLLAALIFVWTPSHFYNLALAYRDDYERGGFPMMPVVRGETTTRKHILFWLGATLAVGSMLIWATDLGWLTAATTVIVGSIFLAMVVRLHHEQTESAAFKAFHASNAYLGLFLVAIVIDAMAL
ncbi:heme o synthase [Halovenus salina]|uniref:heme o synthase n=1 Tax=Halovenus salina TaxID=1510225 RepID=UPI002260A9D7|nr:heme o synthase [Halovenus salina]